MSQSNNPFFNVQINKEINHEVTAGIEREIEEFENRILRIKGEINIVAELIEINTYYSDKETNNFLWID